MSDQDNNLSSLAYASIHGLAGTLPMKINGISFTHRELDIMACIISGRTSKKAIASTLAISVSTAATHTRNIMQKLQCSSWEHIRTFIETSGYTHHLRELFDKTLIHNKFQNILRELSSRISTKKLSCVLALSSNDQEELPELKQIEEVLKTIGIKVIPATGEIAAPADSDNAFINTQYIKLTKTDTFLPNEFNYLAYAITELLILDIIKAITQDDSLSKLISEFKTFVDTIKNQSEHQHITDNKLEIKEKYTLLKPWIIMLSIAIVCVSSYFAFTQLFGTSNYARSDLLLPKPNLLLNRSELLKEIQNRLYSSPQKNSIPSVAICGIGGSGKTTIARMIGMKHKGVVWEINAETEASIKSSFKDLAYALASTQEDKRFYEHINSLQTQQEQVKQFLHFIKDKLRQIPEWLIIFDNVETMSSIAEYLPSDPLVWGQGHVLITTQNKNTSVSTYFNPSDVIILNDLTESERLELFSKTLFKDSACLDNKKSTEVKDFLQQIPPLPLDVTIAGTYIRQSNISCSNYLSRLSQSDFNIQQKLLLKERGDYHKTRQEIISLSMQKLIESNPLFSKLLLVICAINSQGISKDILLEYDNETNVDLFIQELQRYSIITYNVSNKSATTFSIHRYIQEIGFRYLCQILHTDKNQAPLRKVIETLERRVNDAISKGNQEQLVYLIPHLEKLSESVAQYEELHAIVTSILGNVFSNLRYDDTMIISTLENALSVLKKYSITNPIRIARVLRDLGLEIAVLGNYDEAFKHLTLSHKIFSTIDPESIATALALRELGRNYRVKGKYTTALEFAGKAESILKKHNNCNTATAGILMTKSAIYVDTGDYHAALNSVQDCINLRKKYTKHPITMMWTEFWEGVIYYEMGCDSKALAIFKHVESILKTQYSKDMLTPNHAWLYTYLGAINARIGNTKDALQYLEQSKIIYERKSKKFANYYYMRDTLPILGKLYIQLHQYKKAETVIKQGRQLLEEYYGIGSQQTTRTICLQGELALEEGNTELAEEYLQNAYNIAKKNNHIDMYITLEALAALYTKKAQQFKEAKDNAKSQQFAQKAKTCLSEALDIIQNQFPVDSSHIKRIKERLRLNL